MSTEEPRHLYRYRSNFEYADSELIQSRIWAATAESLNDHAEGLHISPREGRGPLMFTSPGDGACVSYSEDPECEIMWAYYGNHHGYCIEYDREECPIARRARRVQYTNNPGELSGVGSRLMKKSPTWRHEREWRVVQDQSGYCSDKAVITGVIAGFRTSNFLMGALEDWAEKQGAVRYGHITRDGAYGLSVVWH